MGDKASLSRATTAHIRQQKILSAYGEIKAAWVKMAEHLYLFVDGQEWRDLGYRSFGEWSEQVDIQISRRQLFKLCEIYRTLVIERHVDAGDLEGIDVTKAYAVLGAVRNDQVPVREALADASVLKLSDLNERYKPRLASGGDINQPLEATNEPAYQAGGGPVCGECGRAWA